MCAPALSVSSAGGFVSVHRNNHVWQLIPQRAEDRQEPLNFLFRGDRRGAWAGRLRAKVQYMCALRLKPDSLSQRRTDRLALPQNPVSGEAVGGYVEDSHDIGLVSQIWQ